MTTYQQYLGQFYIGTDSIDFTLDDGGGADAVQLDVGDYYITGYTGEAATQLVEHMQAKIRAISGYGDGEAAKCTVEYSPTTGKVTIDFDGTSVDIAWTDTSLQSLLGFTGSQTGASSYTAANQARYVWRPSEGIAEYPLDLTRWWDQRTTMVGQRSNDGTTRTVAGNKLSDGEYAYSLLPEADVVTTSSTVWESLEAFWGDVIAEGKPIRCYPDRTLNTSSSYYTAMWAITKDDGAVTNLAGRRRSNYNGLWDVRFKLWEHVT